MASRDMSSAYFPLVALLLLACSLTRAAQPLSTDCATMAEKSAEAPPSESPVSRSQVCGVVAHDPPPFLQLLALPSTAGDKKVLEVGGASVGLDHLGPVVINTDGTPMARGQYLPRYPLTNRRAWQAP